MNRLRKLREEKKLTVRELAEKINMSFSNIATLERGDSQLREDTTQLFCKFYDVSSDYLLGLSDIKKPRITQFGKYEHEIEALLGDDPNLLQTFKDLMKREECALLFSKVKELDASTIKKVLGIINIIEKEESD